jgi:hypothetical protein
VSDNADSPNATSPRIASGRADGGIVMQIRLTCP